jgi:hypothetical protein
MKMGDQNYFNVSYTSNGSEGTLAQLVGPNYNESLIGVYGTFTNVPEGDGFQLTVTYGNTSQSVSVDVHSDITVPVTLPIITLPDNPSDPQSSFTSSGFDSTEAVDQQPATVDGD